LVLTPYRCIYTLHLIYVPHWLPHGPHYVALLVSAARLIGRTFTRTLFHYIHGTHTHTPHTVLYFPHWITDSSPGLDCVTYRFTHGPRFAGYGLRMLVRLPQFLQHTTPRSCGQLDPSVGPFGRIHTLCTRHLAVDSCSSTWVWTHTLHLVHPTFTFTGSFAAPRTILVVISITLVTRCSFTLIVHHTVYRFLYSGHIIHGCWITYTWFLYCLPLPLFPRFGLVANGGHDTSCTRSRLRTFTARLQDGYVPGSWTFAHSPDRVLDSSQVILFCCIPLPVRYLHY